MCYLADDAMLKLHSAKGAWAVIICCVEQNATASEACPSTSGMFWRNAYRTHNLLRPLRVCSVCELMPYN